MKVKGAANVSESKRSKMPPCPLKKLLVSLSPASRFNRDSAKSPNCPNPPAIIPMTITSVVDTIPLKKSY